MRKLSAGAVFAVLLLTAWSLLAQQTGASQDKPIQVDVDVVNIPVSVTDSTGRFIIDLKKEDFEVSENGQPVEIRYFTKTTPDAEEAGEVPPLRVGFLVDLSNTARLYYKTYRESIGDLAYALVPEGSANKGFLIGYHTTADLLVDTTGDPYEIASRMENLKHGGGSSLLDAAYQACAEKLVSDPYQGTGEPRKIVVIVGDGHDNASRRTLEEVIYAAQLNQVTIYAVSTEAWGFQEAQESNLVKMVRATGGRITRPMQGVHKDTAGFLSKPQDAGNYALTVGTGLYTQAQLNALYSAILDIHGNVQSQYILGYVPPTPFSDRSQRDVKVRVKLESEADIQLYYRPSYLPPTL